MAVIGWGKPRLFAKNLSDTSASWIEFPTPVEGTTELATEKGDKQEAKIEGGENEDVRYNKNTYALTCNIRAAKHRKKPIVDNDGLITDNYMFVLQPEDPEVEGILISKATVSVEDTWSSEEGGIWIYTIDALKPDDGSKQVKRVAVTVSGSGDTLDVTYTEFDEETGTASDAE